MTSISHAGWDADFPALLDRQRGLLAELHLLCREQEHIIAGGSPDPASLRRIASRRRNLGDQIARIAQRVEPYRRSWVQAWPTLDPEIRTRLSAAIEGVRGMLDTVLSGTGAGKGARCD
jgi:hypothetical protein